MGTEDERLAIVARVAAELRDLAEVLRLERARRVAAGTDIEQLDRVLAELDPAVVMAHDAEVTGAVSRVLALHGPGPWPDTDLAAMSGVDPNDLRRMRDQLAAAGLASRPDRPDGPDR